MKIKITVDSKLWIYVGLLFVLTLNIPSMINLKVPTILHDEMGYWSNAAYFAGYDWSGITTAFSFYSYGISIFLAIIMTLIHDMILVYKMVMCMNVILLIMMYFMSYSICGFLDDKSKTIVRVMASVISLCYPTYVMNIGIAWAEYYILFFTWLNIFVLVWILKKDAWYKMIIFSAILIYMYMIHQRNIISVLLGCMLIMYLTYIKKISKRSLMLFVITMLGMLVLHRGVKESIQQSLWQFQDISASDSSYSANDYSGRIQMMIYALKNAGIYTIIRSLIGKLYYLLVASCGIYFFGAIAGVRSLFKIIQNKKKNSNILIAYINLLVIGVLIICTISTMQDGISTARIDALIYGRYIESTMGPLLALGVLEMCEHYYSKIIYCRMMICIMVVTIIVGCIYKNGEFSGFLDSCAGGVALYFRKVGFHSFIYFGTLVVILSLTIFRLLNDLFPKITVWLMIIVLIVYGVNGQYLNQNCRNSIQINNQKMIPVSQYIERLNNQIPIYCVRGELPYAYMYLEVLQYLMPERTLSYVDIDDECLNKNRYILIVEDVHELDMNHFKVLMRVDMGWFILLKEK